MNEKDCSTCNHCIDKEIWTCEIDDYCFNHFYYEPEEPIEKFNEIEM